MRNGGILAPRPRWLALAVMLTVGILSDPSAAQHMLDPEAPETAELAERMDALFGAAPAESDLACDLRPVDPSLNFAFRWYTGFRADFPIAQFGTEAVRLRAMFRVRSDSEQGPFYFWEDFTVPEGPRPQKQSGEISGGFFVGEGRYQVEWVLMDGSGRRCYKQWDFELRMDKEERRLSRFVEPGMATPVVIEWNGASEGERRPYRIAVILHVSPVFPRSIRLSSFDESLLATVLTALLEDTPFRESAIYAVNLERKRVLFEAERLDQTNFARLLNSFKKLELGTIDIDVYSERHGAAELLVDIVSHEIEAEDPPDAVIFIGPNNRQRVRFPDGYLESGAEKHPLFFYLHLDYFSRRFPWGDAIERLIDGQGGTVFKLRHPKHLAKALQAMEEQLAAKLEKSS